MLKFANFQVIEAKVARMGHGLVKDSHRHAFQYDPKPGYLYVRSRAISSRCNDNFDEFPADEIAQAYRTFIGKPVFVNHHNANHRRARGVIVDAVLHTDTNPDGSPDTWVEVLMEVDAINFPILASKIVAGEIDRTSMGCFLPGTLITMADGTQRAIQTLQEGDLVLTHTGKVEPVTWTMARPYEGVVYDVRTYGQATPLVATPEHPIWVRRGQPTTFCTCGREFATKASLSAHHREVVRRGHEGVHEVVIERIEGWVEVRDVVEGDMILTPMPDGVGNPGTWAHARLLGYYAAEGNLCWDRKRRGDKPVGVEWNFHEDEVEYVQEVCEALRAIGYSPAGPYIKNTCATVRCNSPELADWFLAMGGQHSWGKRLHPDVMRWTTENQRALVMAYLNGDGCYRGDRVEAGTASRDLAHQIHVLALRSDIPMTPPVMQHSPSAQDAGSRPKFVMQATLAPRVQRTVVEMDAQGMWRKVTGIIIRQYDGDVFNFDVEGDDSYVAADVAVHNCDVAYSKCSYCGNKAVSPVEYCDHIRRHKGRRIRRRTASGDGMEDVLVREICYGLRFFENSLLVEDPADPTAYFLGVESGDDLVAAGRKTASVTARDERKTRTPEWDQEDEQLHPRDQGGKFTDSGNSGPTRVPDGKKDTTPTQEKPEEATPTTSGPTEAPAAEGAPETPAAVKAGDPHVYEGEDGTWHPHPSTTGTGTKEDPVDTESVEDAAKALSLGLHVRLHQAAQVSTLLDRLASMIQKAKADGQKLDIDLCNVTVKGTNLFCVDEETEILTEEGWVTYDRLAVGDRVLTLNHETGFSEWQENQAVNVFPAEPRVVLSMEGRYHSSLTSLNHRWPTINKRSGKRQWRTSETLGWDDAIQTSAPCASLPTEAKYLDALVEVVAWAWTEGTVEGSMLRIYQSATKNPHHCASIRASLTSLYGLSREGIRGGGPGWRETFNEATGMVTFFLNKDAAAPVLDHLGPEKAVRPSFIRSLTEAQLRLFIDRSLDADGHRGAATSLGQRSEARIRSFEMACALAGIRTNTTTQPERRPGRAEGLAMHTASLMAPGVVLPISANAQKGAFAVSAMIHEGILWCPTTPNSTWLARRHGKVFFTGNCTESKGIPRSLMPQLKSLPEGLDPNGRAMAEVQPNEDGEYDIQPQFLQHLKDLGYEAEEVDYPASYLKATQSQLNAGKVAGITDAILNEGADVNRVPIFVSEDDYIVDGHHRWAATVSADWSDGDAGQLTMPVWKIKGLDIITLLDLSNKFAAEWGFKQQSVGDNNHAHIPGQATASKGCSGCGPTLDEMNAHAARKMTSRDPLKAMALEAATKIVGGKKDWSAHDVSWFLPGRKTPIAWSTRATSDAIDLLGDDGLTIRQIRDALLYDDEGQRILDLYIEKGYGDLTKAELDAAQGGKQAAYGGLWQTATGYVHRSQSCPHINGENAHPIPAEDVDEPGVVERYGVKACTTCFPSAPTRRNAALPKVAYGWPGGPRLSWDDLAAIALDNGWTAERLEALLADRPKHAIGDLTNALSGVLYGMWAKGLIDLGPYPDFEGPDDTWKATQERSKAAPLATAAAWDGTLSPAERALHEHMGIPADVADFITPDRAPTSTYQTLDRLPEGCTRVRDQDGCAAYEHPFMPGVTYLVSSNGSVRARVDTPHPDTWAPHPYDNAFHEPGNIAYASLRPRQARGPLDTPITAYGLRYDPQVASQPLVAAAASWDGWDSLPVQEVPVSDLWATEAEVASSSINKVVHGGEPFREGYSAYVLTDPQGRHLIIDGNHRAAMYAALGRTTMPAHVATADHLNAVTSTSANQSGHRWYQSGHFASDVPLCRFRHPQRLATAHLMLERADALTGLKESRREHMRSIANGAIRTLTHAMATCPDCSDAPAMVASRTAVQDMPPLRGRTLEPEDIAGLSARATGSKVAADIYDKRHLKGDVFAFEHNGRWLLGEAQKVKGGVATSILPFGTTEAIPAEGLTLLSIPRHVIVDPEGLRRAYSPSGFATKEQAARYAWGFTMANGPLMEHMEQSGQWTSPRPPWFRSDKEFEDHVRRTKEMVDRTEGRTAGVLEWTGDPSLDRSLWWQDGPDGEPHIQIVLDNNQGAWWYELYRVDPDANQTLVADGGPFPTVDEAERVSRNKARLYGTEARPVTVAAALMVRTPPPGV